MGRAPHRGSPLDPSDPISVPAVARTVRGLKRNPLVRGGMTIVLGLLVGNVLGFARVAITAYLLGTGSLADTLAVALGPMDMLNSMLINGTVFAFVPVLTAVHGSERVAVYLKLQRTLFWAFAAITLALVAGAPLLMRALAPGLDPHFVPTAVANLRILALSTVAAGSAAVECALLYTGRRFLPTAFYQAALNACTIVGAIAGWKFFGVHALAAGYTAGAWVQLAIVYFSARRGLDVKGTAPAQMRTLEVFAKPAVFVLYAAGLWLNVTLTRSWSTHGGPGMAAALDYCMRGVGVPLALIVSPVSNSLLPELARLRGEGRMPDARRLIDRTLGLTAAAAVGITAFALLFRHPAVAIMFQRGSFTAHSTEMVSAVFLGMGPSLAGWMLMEITSRALFSLNRPWPPLVAAAVPALVNASFLFALRPLAPELIGLGASAGFLAGFLVLFAAAHQARRMATARETAA
jgi:putative peptidoglycan lipid II flippase